MLVNPSQILISELGFVAQLAELQSAGYLRESSINFERTLDAVISRGFEAMARPLAGYGSSSAACFLSREALQERLTAWVNKAVRYRPFAPHDFPPLQVLLPRGKLGGRIPLVVEKATLRQAQSVLQDRLALHELEEYLIFENTDSMEPMVFLLRDWDGRPHAMAIAALYSDGDTKSLICCRDLKFDRNPRTSFKDVGIALTLARLVFMKKSGYWSERAPVLRDIRPEILEIYRSRFPKPLNRGMERGEWHIALDEAEHLLTTSTLNLVPLPSLS